MAVSAEKEAEVREMEQKFMATLAQVKAAALPLLWKVGRKKQ